MEERRLATYQKPQASLGVPINLRTMRNELTTPTSKDTYSINNKVRPGAFIARVFAREDGIATKIVDWGKDSEKAWCIVEGYLIDRPAMSHQSIVVEYYSDLLRSAVFDAIENGIHVPTGERDERGRLITRKVIPEYEFGPDGFPTLKDNWARFQLMRNHLGKIKFAERSTMGKAQRNVILELLGKSPDAPAESQPASTKLTPEQDELETCRNRIRVVLMKACEGNRELAKETFADIASKLSVAAKAPADLGNVGDAKRILDEVVRLSQSTEEVVDGSVAVEDGEELGNEEQS